MRVIKAGMCGVMKYEKQKKIKGDNMKTDEMIAETLKFYNEIKESKSCLPSGEYNFSDAFINGELSSVQWILINVFNFKVDDRRL